MTRDRNGTGWPGERHLSAEEIFRLVDAESPPEGAAAHAADCAACAAALAASKALARGLTAMPREPFPPGIETRILAALRARQDLELPGWLAFWSRPAGALVAALVLALLAFGVPGILDRDTSLPADWAWAAGLPAERVSQVPDSEGEILVELLGNATGPAAEKPAGRGAR